MTAVCLSPQAQSDLDEIWAYTAKEWNVDQAETYLRTLDSTFQLLATHPHLGRSIHDIRQGYFKFPVASHLLIFRIKNYQIEIVRILHKSNDVERHL